jgi:hypothetical protein
VPGQRAIGYPLRHGAAVVSRRHFFKETHVPTFQFSAEGVEQASAIACRRRGVPRSNNYRAVLL